MRCSPCRLVVVVAERVLGRAEQQRERRAQLVADVGEERGLGLVELQQAFVAQALLFVGARVREARGDLAGDELDEAAVALVERAVAVQAGDEEAHRGRAERDDERGERRLVPGAGRRIERVDVVDEDRVLGLRPRLGGRGPRLPAVRGQASAVLVVEVHERERQRAAVGIQRAGGRRQHLGLVTRGRDRCAEVAQRGELAPADDLLGVLADHAQHPLDATVVAGEGAVGERVVGLFDEPAALEEQQQRLVPRGLAGLEDTLDAGADVRPDLRPHLPRRATERPRVLLVERVAAVRVVAEERELRPPRHPHAEA